MQDLVATPWLLTLLGGMVLVAGVTSRMLATSQPAPSALSTPAEVLEGWLSDVGAHPPRGVEHLREFHESPDTVFAALVQVLSAAGHIEGIEGYGTVVVFSAQRCPMAAGRPLRAAVRPSCGGTVLEVTSTAAPPATLAERERECVQVPTCSTCSVTVCTAPPASVAPEPSRTLADPRIQGGPAALTEPLRSRRHPPGRRPPMVGSARSAAAVVTPRPPASLGKWRGRPCGGQRRVAWGYESADAASCSNPSLRRTTGARRAAQARFRSRAVARRESGTRSATGGAKRIT